MAPAESSVTIAEAHLSTFYHNCPDYFDLAMCLWHRRDKTEARELYDRSVTWREERLPKHFLLIRYRQQAAELLGIEPG